VSDQLSTTQFIHVWIVRPFVVGRAEGAEWRWVDLEFGRGRGSESWARVALRMAVNQHGTCYDSAMTTDIERWQPPNDPSAFESLCLDLWREIWHDPSAQKNGRSGQPQAGVDVFGQPQGKWAGVQSKQKDGLLRSKVTIKELEAEVEAAKEFKPPLANFILATTGPRDAKVQERARKLTEEHKQLGLFSVEVWSWEDIWDELYRRTDLLTRIASDYWPRLIAASRSGGQRTVRLDRASGLLKLDVPVGDYVEIHHQGVVIKVSIEEIVEREFLFSGTSRRHGRGCHIKVSSGGGLFFCGDYCDKTDVNEFIVPTKEFNLDEPVSVYFFWTSGWHRFFRLFVEHINHKTGLVTLNAFLCHTEVAEERT
jgi:hypothetical protein